MNTPSDRRYTATHEWHKADGSLVTLGITHFAVEELADITFVELPAVGKAITPGKAFGEIESVKATAEIFSAVAGTVAEVNQAVKDDPSIINQDPYEKGWLIKIQAANADLSPLMDAQQYDAAHEKH